MSRHLMALCPRATINLVTKVASEEHMYNNKRQLVVWWQRTKMTLILEFRVGLMPSYVFSLQVRFSQKRTKVRAQVGQAHTIFFEELTA